MMAKNSLQMNAEPTKEMHSSDVPTIIIEENKEGAIFLNIFITEKWNMMDKHSKCTATPWNRIKERAIHKVSNP